MRPHNTAGRVRALGRVKVRASLAGIAKAGRAVASSRSKRRGGSIVLSAADEQDLCLRIINHDCRLSRKRLVRATRSLVTSVARRYTGRGVSWNTLIGLAERSVTAAIETFDPAHGDRFSTYARWGIRQALKGAVQLVNRSRGARRSVSM